MEVVSMKRIVSLFLAITLFALIIVVSGCTHSTNYTYGNKKSTEKSTKSYSSYSYSRSYGTNSYSSFTNKYGTATTKCAHPGCNNYIATSGDTNCCTTHSRKCLECGCYIDEDALYCVSCLRKAIGN